MLSGYYYRVEDDDPYPCIDPIRPMEPELEVASFENSTSATPDVRSVKNEDVPRPPEPDVPDRGVDPPVKGKSKRSTIYFPANEKNDVYNIFKVRLLPVQQCTTPIPMKLGRCVKHK